MHLSPHLLVWALGAVQGQSKCSAPVRQGLTPSLPRGTSALCFGLLYPLSHPARGVAVAQVESFSVLAALWPCHQLRDLTRVMLPREEHQPHSCPGGRGLHLPKSQLGIPMLAFTLSGPPRTFPATSSGLNHIVVSFFADSKQNKTKKRHKKSLNCFSPKPLHVAQQVLAGQVGGSASRCVTVCFLSVS